MDYLDIVDRMHVVHAVEHNSADLLESLVLAYRRHSAALHQDIATREQFDCFESRTVLPNESLSPLHKSFLVCHNVADFDHVRCHLILEHLAGNE